MNLHQISLHPRLGAAVEAVVGFVWFIILYKLATPVFLGLWLVGRVALSVVLSLALVYYPPSLKRSFHAIVLGAFHAGFLPFFLFTDWPLAWFFLAVASIILPAASFFVIPSAQQGLTFEIKPFRRLCLSMSTITVAGIWSALMALVVFQLIGWLDWWWELLAAIISIGFMAMWWHAYEVPFTRRTLRGLLILGLLLVELGFAVMISPAGYLAGGLLLTWWWYLLFLLGRFYLSAAGLSIKKQLPFVITNGVFVLIYLLFFVRWK